MYHDCNAFLLHEQSGRLEPSTVAEKLMEVDKKDQTTSSSELKIYLVTCLNNNKYPILPIELNSNLYVSSLKINLNCYD